MSSNPKEFIEETTENIPAVYSDLLKPAVQETGKLLALLPKTINAALNPLHKWIATQNYSLEEYIKLLAQKLENTNVNKIVSPEAYVAIPAFQAMSYSIDNIELKNMYTNLIANSMNIDLKKYVHPSFVEIIKQMSPNDAKIYKIIATSKIRPILNITLNMNDNYYYIIQRYFSWITEFSVDDCCFSFDNLIRLNLINIPKIPRSTSYHIYDLVKQNPRYDEFIKLHKMNVLVWDETLIELNDYSKQFFEICVK